MNREEMKMKIENLSEIVERGVKEGIFNTPYPRETAEFLMYCFRNLSEIMGSKGVKAEIENFENNIGIIIEKINALLYISDKVLETRDGIFEAISGIYEEYAKNIESKVGD